VYEHNKQSLPNSSNTGPSGGRCLDYVPNGFRIDCILNIALETHSTIMNLRFE